MLIYYYVPNLQINITMYIIMIEHMYNCKLMVLEQLQ